MFTQNLFSQKFVTEKYYYFKLKADSCYNAKKFNEAALLFNNAFKEMGKKSLLDDRYNAACCWALSNRSDSAFNHLKLLLKNYNFSDYKGIISDKDLISLHTDKRWNNLVKTIQTNFIKVESKLNHRLMRIIDSMKVEDQKWRGLVVRLSNKEIDSASYSKASIYKNLNNTDSLNYFICKKIFDKYGFPNYENVGKASSDNFWLLVQHQDKHSLFQMCVLKKMKIEVKKGLANGINYAYLIDRVKVNTNQLQIYGTQMVLNKDSTSYIPKPVVDEIKLNERRKSIGLNPIEEYIKSMNARYFGDIKK